MNSTLTYALVSWLFLVGIYQGNKSLPQGFDYASEVTTCDSSSIELLIDLTSIDSLGKPYYQHEIFDSLFFHLNHAEKYILIDMFLFNQYTGPSGTVYRNITGELKDILIDRKLKYPDLKIDFITDPVNTFYAGCPSPELIELEEYGINIIVTDLTATRDSAPAYSSIWRTFFQWFGNSERFGILPNPFDSQGTRVTVRSYLDFLNLKANHRKICIIDSKTGPVSFIMSANPHSASSDFSNVALMVRGRIAKSLYETERVVAEISGAHLQGDSYISDIEINTTLVDQHSLQILTEEQIKLELIRNIDEMESRDSLYIGMFYFSNRAVIRSLLQASERGAKIRMILDPNKDGFGFYRSGIPNQVSGGELFIKSGGKIDIRWYETHGEEYHAKMALFLPALSRPTLLLGSANYTRKNLNNYNLELDVKVAAALDRPIMHEAHQYFEKLWHNQDFNYTAEYDKYKQTSVFRTIQYRFQEFTGLGVY